jgi:hypothetical protein
LALLNKHADATAEDINSHSHCYCTLDGLFSVDWEQCCDTVENSGRHLRPRGPLISGDDEKDKMRISKLLEHMLKDESLSEVMKATLTRGTQELVAEIDGKALAQDDSDVLAFETKTFEINELERLLIIQKEQEDFPTRPFTQLTSTVTPSRRQILDRYSAYNGPGYYGRSIVDDFKRLESRILNAGADPADFRLLICFDN